MATVWKTGLVVLTVLAAGCVVLLALRNTQSTDDSASIGAIEEIRARLVRVESMVADQATKVNRSYKAVEPFLIEAERQADRQRKQDREDEALAMSEVVRRTVSRFTGKRLILPGTNQLLLAHNDASLHVVELPSGQSLARLKGFDGIPTCIASDRASRCVIVGTAKGTIYRCDVLDQKVVTVHKTTGWPVDSLAVSVTGEDFAWATNGRRGKNGDWESPGESAQVINAKRGTTLFGLPVGRGDYQALSFSGDGSSLAIVQSGDVAIVDAVTGRVRERLRHPQHQSGPLSVAYAPSKQLLAVGYAPCHVALWDPIYGMTSKLLSGHSNWVVSLAFTLDGQMLISSAGDGTASVWDTDSGQEIGRLRFRGRPYVRSVSAARPYVAIARRGEFVICRLPDGERESRVSSIPRS